MIDCKVECRKVVTRATLNRKSGERMERGQTVEIEPCDAPLLSDREKKSGICDSCAAGWSVADNQITPRGREQLKQAKAKS
jgi:hypothetical protein